MRFLGKAKQILELGDLLMVTQNWFRNGVQLYNGDHVELLHVDWKIQEEVAGLHFVAVKIGCSLQKKKQLPNGFS